MSKPELVHSSYNDDNISAGGEAVPTTAEGVKRMIRYAPHHVALGVLWLALGVSESVQHSIWNVFQKDGTSYQLLVDVGLLVMGALYIGLAVNSIKKAFIYIAERS